MNGITSHISTFFNDTDYSTVPPSGTVTFGTREGWDITSGDLINISGNGSLQRYDLILIGAGLPLVINADSIIRLESAGNVSFDKVISDELGFDPLEL